MKKLTFIFAVLSAVVLVSCGGQKKAVEEEEIEIKMPCHGPEQMSNSEFFRASGIGFSNDMSIARKKALSNARAELATTISATMKRVANNYASSYQMGESEEAKSKFEDLSKTVVNTKLSGTPIVCQKMMKTKTGQYKAYVAVQLSGEEIAKEMQNRIQKDAKLRIDYEYEKFKNEFDKEMQNLEGGAAY